VLITNDYKAQQEKLHDTGNYGVTAKKYGPLVSSIVDKLEIDHLLDYGCGSNLSLKETLQPHRDFIYQAYDPCVPRFAGEPEPADLVCCIDVLEHIEPDLSDNVLDHLAELAQVAIFVSINTGPAGKVLDDGRNAHLIQQPMEWWLPKLWERFTIQTVQVSGLQEFFVIANHIDLSIEVGPKPVISQAVINGEG
jgi:hypothetical protein